MSGGVDDEDGAFLSSIFASLFFFSLIYSAFVRFYMTLRTQIIFLFSISSLVKWWWLFCMFLVLRVLETVTQRNWQFLNNQCFGCAVCVRGRGRARCVILLEEWKLTFVFVISLNADTLLHVFFSHTCSTRTVRCCLDIGGQARSLFVIITPSWNVAHKGHIYKWWHRVCKTVRSIGERSRAGLLMKRFFYDSARCLSQR